ncbi:MAG: MATE family efflux transporter, partial [Myxococcales bacterium]
MDNSVDREIWRLSAATFVALVSEPLLLLADAAIVGHLGTPELAGLGIASAVLGTVMSLSIFLAYGTTSGVSRLVGAGRERDALALGIDGLWLATLLGGLITAVGLLGNRTIIGWFGPTAEVADQAAAYLQIAWLGTIPMLLMLASVGILRGVKDVRTPMLVAVAINLTNIVLNYLLVYVVGWDIRGAATGTVVAQVVAAVWLGTAVVRRARTVGAPLAPDRVGIKAAATTGVPLVVRTLLLRAALLLMTWQATSYGAPELATMQLALTIWTFLSFALDALGISAQTLVGTELGRGDRDVARQLTTRLIWWSLA